MIEANAVQWGVAIGASLAAAILDVRTRRIPNRLTFPLVVTGLIAAVIINGLSGLGSCLAACVVLAITRRLSESGILGLMRPICRCAAGSTVFMASSAT